MTRTTSSSGVDPRGLWLLLGLYLATLLAAAVVTPLLYWGVRAWAAHSSSDLLAYLARKDFPRYFDRIRWLFVLLGLPWLCRRSGLTGATTLGLRAVGGAARPTVVRAAAWFAAGTAMVALIAAGQLATGIATLRPPPTATALAAGVAVALLAAALIAFFEELVFRGVVFQLAEATLPLLPAAVVASLFFAILHFQRVPGSLWPADAAVGPGTGFTVAWWSVASMVRHLDVDAFLALAVAGLILCLVFVRGRSLYPAMGLHAGWVWTAQVIRRWVHVDPAGASERAVAWWGGKDMIDGWIPLALLILLVAGLAVSTAVGSSANRSATGSSSSSTR